jgi:hypothetical protein
MQEFGFKSDDLLDFIDDLRRYGYRITPEQCISAQNLVLALAAFGNPNDLASRLHTYLGPILCTSPEEQESFEQYFNQWQYGWANRNAVTNQSAKSDALFERVLSLLRNPALILALISTMVVLVSVWLSKQDFGPILQPPSFTLTGRVADTSGTPFLNAVIRYKGQTTHTDASGTFSLGYRATDLPFDIVVEYPGYKPVTYQLNDPQTNNLRIIFEKTESRVVSVPPLPNEPSWLPRWLPVDVFIVLIVLIVAAVVIVALGWPYFRRSALRKKLTRKNVKVEQLFVKGAGQQFARLFALRRIARELRRPEAISSSDLNVTATIDETIVRGIFTSITTPRRASPEYLVLIDRAGFNDQQASLEDEVVKRLIKSDVYINRFYFQNDPRLCRREDGKTSYVSLRELAALYGNRRLIIFGDGSAFFNPISGRLERWTSIFSNWQRRVLLTPQNINTDYRRSSLIDQGFVVMPAGKESLSALADILNETPSTARWSRKSEPFPDMLLDRPERWVDSHSPSSDILDKLCEELRRFLGPQGYSWLGACAVYPMLHWDLTLYVGYKLAVEFAFGTEYWVDQTFKSLMQLPWFRHGSIPDWLRTRLISDLSVEQRRHVRKALEELLMSSLGRPKGLALPIVIERPESNWSQGILQRALRIANRGGMRLRHVIKTASSESPLRDHVFLSFMTRFRYNELVLAVPQKVQKALTSRHEFVFARVFNFLLQHGEESLAEQSGYEFLIPPSGSEKKRSSSRRTAKKKHLRKTILGRVTKLWNTSTTYNATLFTFAYFSLGAWILWALHYTIFLLEPVTPFASDLLRKTGLWLGLMENILWASAVLSLHSKKFSRKSLTAPLLAMFAIVMAVVAYQTTILTSKPFTYIEAVSTATIFMLLTLSIMQLRLSKLFAVIFFLYGYFQWIWKSLWLTPLGTTWVVRLAFPLWHIAVFIAWMFLISEMRGTFRVMISSTIKDLGPERAAAEGAVQSLQLDGLRAEKIESLPYTPKALSALWAEQCDIFILIIGERYGHLIEPEAISIAEFEYKVAHAQDPAKVFVYVKEDVDREPSLEEFLKRLQDFESGYFSSPFSTPEELQGKIKRDIKRWLLALERVKE